MNSIGAGLFSDNRGISSLFKAKSERSEHVAVEIPVKGSPSLHFPSGLAVPKEKMAKYSWLKELDSPEFKKRPKLADLKLLALESADPYIRDTAYEGGDFTAVFSHFSGHLSRATLKEAKKLTIDLKPFDEMEDLSREMDATIRSGRLASPEVRLALIEDLSKKYLARIKEMKRGDELWLPGGWNGADGNGHALVYRIERQKNGKYSWTIFNSGEGLDYHPTVFHQGQMKYQTFLKRENIDPKTIQQQDFWQSALELQINSAWNKSINASAKDVYEGLLGYLGGSETKPLDFKKYSYLYMKEQRAGSCTVKALYATLHWLVLKEGEGKKRSSRDALDDYKHLKFLYKKQALLDGCRYFLDENTPWNRSDQKLISEIRHKLARSAIKLWDRQVISKEELQGCDATLQDIRQKFREKKDKHLEKLRNSPKVEYSPLKSELSKQNPKQSIELQDLPKLGAGDLKPEEMARIFKEWKVFAEKETRNPEEAKIRRDAVVEFVRQLPIPTKKDSDFWRQIPDDQIDSCSLSILEISEIFPVELSEFEESVAVFCLAGIVANLVKNQGNAKLWAPAKADIKKILQSNLALNCRVQGDLVRFQALYQYLETSKVKESAPSSPIFEAPADIDRQDLSPKTVTKVLRDWKTKLNELLGKKVQLPGKPSESKIVSADPLLVCEAVARYMRNLPIPTKSPDDFWNKIPKDQITPCLKELTDVIQSIYKCKTPIPLPVELFISLYKALAIGDKLARRLQETKLDGYHVSHYELISFAQSANVKLLNPMDQEDLKDLLTYFNNGELDLSRHVEEPVLKKFREESIFTYPNILGAPINFDVDKYSIKKNPSMKYFTQFLEEEEVREKLEKNGFDDKSKSEQLACLLMDSCSSESQKEKDRLLPPSVFCLRQLAMTCWGATFELKGRNVSEEIIGSERGFELSYSHEKDGSYYLQILYEATTDSSPFRSYTNDFSSYASVLPVEEFNTYLEQNALMCKKNLVKEELRDQVILNVEARDEVARVLSYFHSHSQNILSERANQEILLTHLFRPGRLLPQLVDEPRMAIKLMAFIQGKLEYFESKKDWKTCLFLASLGAQCGVFIEEAKKLVPKKYSKFIKDDKVLLFDYRQKVLKDIFPKCESLRLRHLACQYLARMHLHVKNPDFVKLTQDLISEKLYSHINRDNVVDPDPKIKNRREEEIRQLYLHFLPQVQKRFESDDPQYTDRVLNHVASVLRQSPVKVSWTGKFPRFESGDLLIDIEKGLCSVGGKSEGYLPVPLSQIIDYEYLFKDVQKSLVIGLNQYEVIDAHGSTYLTIKDRSCLLQREIDGKMYKYVFDKKGPFPDTFALVDLNAKVWLCSEGAVPHYRVEASDGNTYYCHLNRVFKNGVWDFQVDSISDTLEGKRLLVMPNKTSSLVKKLIALENEKYIQWWASSDRLETIQSIDLPRLNLHFDFKYDKEFGSRAFCKELPGFYIAQNQNVDFKFHLKEWLILENSLGERKVVIPRRTLAFGDQDVQNVFDPEVKQDQGAPTLGMISPSLIYDLEDREGHFQLRSHSVEDTFYLIYALMAKKQYTQAYNYLKKAYGLVGYSSKVEEVIGWIRALPNDKHPSAISLRMLLALTLRENQLKYFPEKDKLFTPDQREQLQKDYLAYVQNLSNSTLIPFTKEQEITLIKILLKLEDKEKIDQTDEMILKDRLKFLSEGKDSKPYKLSSVFKKEYLEKEATNNEKGFLEAIVKPSDSRVDRTQIMNLDVDKFKALLPDLYASLRGENGKERKQQASRFLRLVESNENFDTRTMLTYLNHLKSVLKWPRWYPSLANIVKANNEDLSFPNEKLLKKFKRNYRDFPVVKHDINTFIISAPTKEKRLEPIERKLETFELLKGQDLINTDRQMTASSPTTINRLETSIEEDYAELKRMEQEVVELVNSVSETASAIQALERKGRKIKLTFQDAIDLFEEGNLEAYKTKTLLSPSQIKDLEAKVSLYLLGATHHERHVRTLNFLRKLASLPLDSTEREGLGQRIQDEIDTKRQYWNLKDETLIRSFLVFEYRNKIFLRKKQVDALKYVVEHESPMQLLAQLGTGSGKSKVLAPLMQWLRRKVPHLVMNIWPTALYPENRKDMGLYSETSFGQRADTFDFDRNSRVTVEQLDFLESELSKDITEKRQLNAKPESAQSFELKFVEVLKKMSQGTPKIRDASISLFQKMLKSIWSGEAHIDEGHVNLSARREVNFTGGDPVSELPEYVTLIEDLYRLLTSDPTIKKIVRLKENQQSLMAPEQFKRVVGPKLADKMAEKFGIEAAHLKEFKRYVLGDIPAPPKWISQHPRKSEIGLLRGELSLLLLETLKGSVNVGYGLSHKNPSIEYAKPYDASDSPIEGAEYENVHETLNKTYQTYLHQRLNVDQEWKIIGALQSQALTELKNSPLGFELADTLANQFYLKNFPAEKMGNLLLLQKEHIQKWHKEIQKRDELVYFYISRYIAPAIKRYPYKIKSDSQNLRSMFGSFMTMTATPGAERVYGKETKTRVDAGSDETVVKTLREKCKNPGSIHVLSTREPLKTLDKILEESFKVGSDSRMIIDIGSLFKGVSNLTIAKRMLDHFKNDPVIKGVVFCDSEDRLVILEKGKTDPIPLAESTLKPEERCTYCANKQIFGLDTKQMSLAKGIATLDVNTDLDSVLQGVGRLREFLKEQTIEWVVLAESKEVICKGKPLDFEVLYKHFEKNKTALEAQNLYRSIKQQMRNELRSVLMQKLIFAEPREVISLFKSFEKVLIEAVEKDPFMLYGQESKEIPAVESLALYKKEIIKQTESISKLTKKEKAGIRTKLDSYDKVIDDLEKEGKLPALVKQLQDQMGSDCEVQQNVETNTETKNAASPGINLPDAPHKASLWPAKLDILKDDWFTPKKPAQDSLLRRVTIVFINAMDSLRQTLNKKCEALAKYGEDFNIVAGTLVRTPLMYVVLIVGLGITLVAALEFGAYLSFWTIHQVTHLIFSRGRCSVYRVSDVVKIEKDSDISAAYGFFKAVEGGELLMTNNFVKKSTDDLYEFTVKALSVEQKSLYEVLVIEDRLPNGEKKMTVIMGDQSTDMPFWRKKLREDQEKISSGEEVKRRMCVYDLHLGIVQDSNVPFEEKELQDDEVFQKLLVQAKVYNGDVIYTKQEEAVLKSMVENQAVRKRVAEFFRKAQVWHDQKEKQFKDSPIDLALRSPVI